tara:strand:+ start:274 stop:459 length:186 start_codon:yes stop_codon:yes gene_type:complete
MSKARAKEAVQKSEDYKEIIAALAAEASHDQPDLQPKDGYINPLGRMGVVSSGNYNEYNMA